MTRSLRLTDEPPASLLQRYTNAARAHGAATRKGDHKGANRAYGDLLAAYQALKGKDAREDLVLLLKHADPGVRVWAARHTIDLAPDEARPVLEAIASTTGPESIDASMLLEQWRSGKLQIP